jgi:cell division transport system permease protein
MIAGVISSVILLLLIQYAQSNIEGFALLQNHGMLLFLFFILIISGGILSLFSTLRAVNKYLNMSLDELY